MPECWLKPNRRALRIALVAPLTLMLVGAIVAAWGYARGGAAATFLVGVVLAFAGAVGAAWLLYALRIPRLAYDGADVLVYLRSLTPLRVPVDAVECFFLGQGPALPAAPQPDVTKAANVIVRLAEGAKDYHTRQVRSDLGVWSDGYITIRGMWCEPLDHQRVNELNRQLGAAHRAQRKPQQVS
jgi:hypothetical protein